MNERQTRLASLGLPSSIVSLATQATNDPLFNYRCGPQKYTQGHDALPKGITVLWECTYGIVGVRPAGRGWEYVEFDIEAPEHIDVIATTEQGLLFWLFSYLIEDQDWHDEAEALGRLRRGAEAVSFALLDDVLQFHNQHGAEVDYGQKLLERSREPTA